MIRVLTPIGIALFFISYPPFHRLLRFKSRSCFDACDISRSFSSAVTHDQRHSRRLAVKSAICRPERTVQEPLRNWRNRKTKKTPPLKHQRALTHIPSGMWEKSSQAHLDYVR